jgi:hypothetical protein
MEQAYDVALWRFWPSTFPDRVEYVSAVNPLAAIMSLMQSSGLTKVQHAAVRPVAGGAVVSYDVVRVYASGVYTQPDQSWRR